MFKYVNKWNAPPVNTREIFTWKRFGAARGTTTPGTVARRVATGTGRMTRTGTTASGFAWFPARWRLSPDDASSCARISRDETRETLPCADIYPWMKKGRGGAAWP